MTQQTNTCLCSYTLHISKSIPRYIQLREDLKVDFDETMRYFKSYCIIVEYLLWFYKFISSSYELVSKYILILLIMTEQYTKLLGIMDSSYILNYKKILEIRFNCNGYLQICVRYTIRYAMPCSHSGYVRSAVIFDVRPSRFSLNHPLSFCGQYFNTLKLWRGFDIVIHK